MKAKSEYAKKLLDPRWQRKRLEILQRDNFTCQMCDATDKTLHVHHKQYKWGKEPWDYDNSTLETLCFECHEEKTIFEQELKDAQYNLAEAFRRCDTDVMLSLGGLITPEALTALRQVLRATMPCLMFYAMSDGRRDDFATFAAEYLANSHTITPKTEKDDL